MGRTGGWFEWGRVVERGYAIRIDVINPNILVLDQHFPLLGRGNWEIGFILQHLDTSSLVDYDSFHGLWDGGRHCADGVWGLGIEMWAELCEADSGCDVGAYETGCVSVGHTLCAVVVLLVRGREIRIACYGYMVVCWWSRLGVRSSSYYQLGNWVLIKQICITLVKLRSSSLGGCDYQSGSIFTPQSERSVSYWFWWYDELLVALYGIDVVGTRCNLQNEN